MRRNRLFNWSLAAIAALLTSGCFYSDKPLLAPSEYAQPIRAGLWESLTAVEEPDWQAMPPEARAARHCRMIDQGAYCAERVRIAVAAGNAYETRDADGGDITALAMAPLADGSFIGQQLTSDGAAEYGLVIVSSPDQFLLRLPSCQRHIYLHVFAPPEGGSTSCRVADRERLGKLFALYLVQSGLDDAKHYRRIGD